MPARTDRHAAAEDPICASWLAALDQSLENVSAVIQAFEFPRDRQGRLTC
jgi:hypothetical protein